MSKKKSLVYFHAYSHKVKATNFMIGLLSAIQPIRSLTLTSPGHWAILGSKRLGLPLFHSWFYVQPTYSTQEFKLTQTPPFQCTSFTSWPSGA